MGGGGGARHVQARNSHVRSTINWQLHVPHRTVKAKKKVLRIMQNSGHSPVPRLTRRQRQLGHLSTWHLLNGPSQTPTKLPM